MEDTSFAAIGEVLALLNSNGAWRSLGFSHRPRGGSIPRKYLRADWKNLLDYRATQQIVALGTAAAVLGGAISRSDLYEVVSVYADGLNGDADLFRTFGYESRDNAVTHLYDSIVGYIDSKPTEWSSLLAKHLDVFNLPDKQVIGKLLVGVVDFCRTMSFLADKREWFKDLDN